MNPLDHLTTALAGRYEVEREIGAGGMATVYLARDVKHKRRVALKVLKAELGAVLGVERFLSEIQVTANLQHPNLLPLFDSGEADGLLFYVMPFVDGESLRARLEREKQLPIDEAVRIATAIAAALDYAHGHGVIHRDLKPENILLQAGQPVIADFGIALAVSNAGGARVTQTGLSLGTPQYMSPEQATGDRVIDARSDIYSLGAVTYEMLVGDPPHLGSTAQAIIAKVLTERPSSVRVARPMVSERVALAVERSLEKLPADRWSSAREFADALHGKISTEEVRAHLRPDGARESGEAPRWMRRALVATTIMAIGGMAAAAWLATRPAARPPAARFVLGLPDSVTLYAGGGTKLALSRDGTRIVFVGVKRGQRALYLRRIDDPVAQPLRGGEVPGNTVSNVSPKFSPDGEWIVFMVAERLMKIPAAGGTAQTLADSGSGSGGSWGDRGTLVYGRAGALWMGTAEGRDGRLLARPDSAKGVYSYGWPEILPGAEYAVLSMNRAPGAAQIPDSLRLGVVSLTTGAVTDLGVYGTNPHYAATGHIVFGRAGGLVFAAPFSLRKRALTGPPTLLLENVWLGSGGATGFAVSDNGTLAYHTGTQAGAQEFVVVNRAGTVRVIPGASLNFQAPRVSPDGRRIAVEVRGLSSGKFSTSLIDVVSGARERLIDDDSGRGPEWTRDGARVVFRRFIGDTAELVARAPDRSAPDAVLLRDRSARVPGVTALAPPRGWAAFQRSTSGKVSVYIAPMDSIGALRPFATGSADHHSPAVSADGRLVAWVSDESGSDQVYAQPIPGPGARVQVSVGGGAEPVWSRSGSTIFYRGPERIMSADVGGVPLRVTRRDTLFADPYTRPFRFGRWWDVLPGGMEFVLLRVFESETSGAYVVLNWPQMKSLQRGASAPER